MLKAVKNTALSVGKFTTILSLAAFTVAIGIAGFEDFKSAAGGLKKWMSS